MGTPRQRFGRTCFAALTTVAPAIWTDAVWGAQITWTNASSDGLWETNANWSLGSKPVWNDQIILPVTAVPENLNIALTEGVPAIGRSLTANDTYTISGGTLALAWAQPATTFKAAGGKLLTINSKLQTTADGVQFVSPPTGSGPTGTIALTADNTGSLTGPVYVDAGTLRITSMANLGNPSSVTIRSNTSGSPGTLEIDATLTTDFPFILTSNGALGVTAGNTVTLDTASQYPYLGKRGEGKLVVRGAGFQTGEVNGGTLRVESFTSIPLHVNLNQGTLEFTEKVRNVAPRGAGTGSYTVRAFGNAEILETITAPSGQTAHLETIAASDTLTLNRATTSASLPGSFRFAGPGTLLVSDKDAINRSWTVDGGTARFLNLNPSVSSSVPLSITAGSVDLAGSGSLSWWRPVFLNDGAELRRSNGTFSSPATLTVADNAIVTLAATGPADILSVPVDNGLVGGVGATIRVEGTGLVAPSGANSYAGGWDARSGLLRLRNVASLGTGTSAVTVGGSGAVETFNITTARDIVLNDGGTLRGNGGSESRFSGNIAVAGGASVGLATVNASDVLTIGDSATDLTGGAGSTIASRGPGTIVLIRPTDYDGAVNVTQGTLAIASAASGTPAAVFAAVNVSPAAKFDLRDNAMIVRESSGVAALVASGRNSGFWNGPGITTSMSDATGGSGYTMLGVASAGDVCVLGESETAVWAGQTVTGSDALVMYTYGGDANLCGYVDIDDYGLIDFNASIGGVLTGWFNGDFNYDGVQDIDDYGIIDFVVNIQGPPFETSSAMNVASVPEPTAACGLAFLAASLLTRRRR